MTRKVRIRIRPTPWIGPVILGMLLAFMASGACGRGSRQAAAGAAAVPPAPTRPSLIRHVEQVAVPASGLTAQEDLVASVNMTTRIFRMGPGAQIEEHHHAGYDETFVVQQGRLRLLLNGAPYDLRAGDVVVIPSNTAIRGVADQSTGAIAVIVWSNTGEGGPLMTPGRPRSR